VPNAFGVSLARNRRSPKRPSEPRPSGAHPEEDAVEKDAEPACLGCWVGGCELSRRILIPENPAKSL